MADDDSKSQKALKAFGKSLSQSSQTMMDSARDQAMRGAESERERSQSDSDRLLASNRVPSYKRGGTVRKTGLARVHKGEFVVPRSKMRKLKRMKSGRY